MTLTAPELAAPEPDHYPDPDAAYKAALEDANGDPT